MSGREIPASWVFFGLFTLVVVGIGLLIWLSDVPAGNLTPAQDSLLTVADWMVKASVGALVGFAGARAGSRHADPPSS